MEEEWKIIDGFPDYKISTLGNIMSKKWGDWRKLNPCPNKKGYMYVSLNKNTKRFRRRVQRLVAIAFLPNYYGLPQVDHKDRNKQNNSIYNLRWASAYTNSMNRSNTRTDIDEKEQKKRRLITDKQSYQRAVDEKRFYCETCNQPFHNNFTLQEHYTSPIHLRILNFKPTTAHYCRPCGVSCRDKHGLKKHIDTPSHKKRNTKIN